MSFPCTAPSVSGPILSGSLQFEAGYPDLRGRYFADELVCYFDWLTATIA